MIRQMWVSESSHCCQNSVRNVQVDLVVIGNAQAGVSEWMW